MLINNGKKEVQRSTSQIMERSFGYKEIKTLQNLLSPTEDSSGSDEDLCQNDKRRRGDVTVQKGVPSEYTRPHAPLKGKDDIWHPSEVSAASVIASTSETNDPRKIPEYEIKFKQSVKTEDIFLNMGFKTPGTASCEWLSVFIKLPQEDQEKIELSVHPEAVDVRSPKYRLNLPTPHTVDPNASNAKWHGDTYTLELTLRLLRELDDMEFTASGILQSMYNRRQIWLPSMKLIITEVLKKKFPYNLLSPTSYWGAINEV